MSYTRRKRGRQITRRYGVSLDEFDHMSDTQGHACAICREAESETARDGRTIHLSIDHCHRDGSVRGLLCATCNRAIGCLNDDPWLLLAAARYLITHQLRRLLDREEDPTDRR